MSAPIPPDRPRGLAATPTDGVAVAGRDAAGIEAARRSLKAQCRDPRAWFQSELDGARDPATGRRLEAGDVPFPVRPLGRGRSFGVLPRHRQPGPSPGGRPKAGGRRRRGILPTTGQGAKGVIGPPPASLDVAGRGGLGPVDGGAAAIAPPAQAARRA